MSTDPAIAVRYLSAACSELVTRRTDKIALAPFQRQAGVRPSGERIGPFNVAGNRQIPLQRHVGPVELCRLPSNQARRRGAGFVLIIVLWTLVLIAFIVAHLTAMGRTEIRIAGNLVANAAAEAAADGAISEAIFKLSDPSPDQRWPIDGTAREVAIGRSRVILRLEDEARRINPNSAPPLLLEALLRAIGTNPESAHRLAAAIGEWVGSAAGVRSQDAVLSDYRAAGLDYGPPVTPLETLDELGRVLGMTPSVLAAMRPHLTLFGPPEPNPAGADPIVAAALALIAHAPQAGSVQSLAVPDVVTVRITAIALGPGNARVKRAAVVRIGPMLPHGYATLAWGAGFD
jgi:general secretion pathway protein K